MEELNNQKYGVKLTVISVLDYEELKEIADAIQRLGYNLTFVNNGNIVCEKIVLGELK
jgi:hypothetical protein